jgi:hypothetical protein
MAEKQSSSIRRRPSALSCFPTTPLPTAFYPLGARGATFPSNRIADIFLICLIVFFGPVFASRVLGSASGARQNFDCLRTPPICS